MQLQIIVISSERRGIYEKLLGELSKEELWGEPKFFKDEKLFKYSSLIVATPEEAEILNQKLNKMKKELDKEYEVNARYC